MKLSKKLVLSIVGVAAVAVAAYQFLLKPDTRLGQVIPIMEIDHISENAPTPEYNSNPPTSGPHATAVRGGFYSFEVKDIFAVHNLEHGFIWITYKDVDEQTLSNLAKIGQQFPETVLISPRKANDAPIALASWGRLEKMEMFDEAFILEFIQKNKNYSPEPFAK